MPHSSHCGAGEYCCHVVHCQLPGAAVCGWCVFLCAVCVVGYPLSAPPSQWWWVGPLWMVGGIADGGWHGEGRAAVLLTPRRMLASPSCVWCPPSVCVVVLLNGGGGVSCCSPVSCCPSSSSQCSPSLNWIRHLILFSPLCIAFPRVVLSASSSCCRVAVVCCVWSYCVWSYCERCVLFFLLPRLVCSLSQHCWFGAVSL